LPIFFDAVPPAGKTLFSYIPYHILEAAGKKVFAKRKNNIVSAKKLLFEMAGYKPMNDKILCKNTREAK
jgi:hypothetical protein